MEYKISSKKETARVAGEFARGIYMPKKRAGRQILLCPIGIIGAGKTTVLKPLSKKLSLVRVSTDELRILFRKNGYVWESSREIAYDFIKKYLLKGFSVAIDADCISEKAQNFIKQIRKQINPEIIWIHINPPEKFIIHKLKTYKHGLLFKDAKDALDNYFKQKPLHKNLNFPFVYTFDTSRHDLKQQIQEATTIIKNLFTSTCKNF